MKCPNCEEVFTSKRIGEARSFEIEKKYALHLKTKHQNICFFCERVGMGNKGTALVDGYLLCVEHTIFIQRNSEETIKNQFGQDIDAKQLKKTMNLGTG